MLWTLDTQDMQDKAYYSGGSGGSGDVRFIVARPLGNTCWSSIIIKKRKREKKRRMLPTCVSYFDAFPSFPTHAKCFRQLLFPLFSFTSEQLGHSHYTTQSALIDWIRCYFDSKYYRICSTCPFVLITLNRFPRNKITIFTVKKYLLNRKWFRAESSSPSERKFSAIFVDQCELTSRRASVSLESGEFKLTATEYLVQA